MREGVLFYLLLRTKFDFHFNLWYNIIIDKNNFIYFFHSHLYYNTFLKKSQIFSAAPMYNNNVAAAHRRSSCPGTGAAAQLICGENLTAQAMQLVAHVRPWVVKI